MRILMRGLYVFCIIALSASCAQITDEGFVDGSGAVAVSRIVNGGGKKIVWIERSRKNLYASAIHKDKTCANVSRRSSFIY